VTGTCLAVSVTASMLVELIFGTGLADLLRAGTTALIVVPLLAIPFARAFGKAHLELFHAKQQADLLSHTDQLTGLPNRRALMDVAERELPEILALVIVDIDRFKHINDTHGHLAGDDVLRQVAQAMASALGEFGCVARIGGEEFALVCAKAPIDSLITKLIDFRVAVEATPVLVNGVAVHVTVSAGVALRAHGDTFDQLFSRADRALYSAKSNGRNRVHFCTPSDEPRDLDGGDVDRLEHDRLKSTAAGRVARHHVACRTDLRC
jgi:diguanylate cyclase (GGDEF)-like protein